MKKIIAAFDGLKYSESTASYAIELAKKFNGKLVGIFLEDFTYHSYRITDLIGEDSPEQRAAYLNKRDAEERGYAVSQFRTACEDQHLLYSIHRDRNIAIRELLHETLFADLLVVQQDETLTCLSERGPSSFVTSVLEKSECPVIVVPPIHREIEKIVFLYDGSPSSVFAIKQFSYTLPAYEGLSAHLLSITPEAQPENGLPDAFYMREWLKLNYPDLRYHVVPGEPTKEIKDFISNEGGNCIVVLGAYHRSSLSRMMHSSMADNIIRSKNVPLFISHK